jgi:sensory rhodopsin
VPLTTLWYWVGTVGMAAAAVLPLRRLLVDPRRWRHYAVLALVPGIATAAYVAMALGVGRIGTPAGSLLVPRYIDWLLTTPLLVLYLGMLADPDHSVYAALVGVDVVIIGSGIVAGALPNAFGWVAFGIGSVAYLGLLYLLLAVLPKQAMLSSERVYADFTKLRNLTVVLWTLYPVVWALSPLGVGLLQTSTEALVVTYLDLISKVGFVVIALHGHLSTDPRESDRPGSASTET